MNSIPDENARSAGAAYVFVRSNGINWLQQAYPQSQQHRRSDVFSGAVAVSAIPVVVRGLRW